MLPRRRVVLLLTDGVRTVDLAMTGSDGSATLPVGWMRKENKKADRTDPVWKRHPEGTPPIRGRSLIYRLSSRVSSPTVRTVAQFFCPCNIFLKKDFNLHGD